MMKCLLACLAVALLAVGGCKAKPTPPTSLQRKEAAALVQEARFAVSVRDLARAEGLLVQATALCADAGDYWLELGQVRVRAGNRAGAKPAYESAVDAYQAEAAADVNHSAQAILRQIYVLALLGRADEARTVFMKAQREQPTNRDLRAFAEAKQLDQLLASPGFKEIAL
jgi:tetratricopeptide (TPR) repeat protein